MHTWGGVKRMLDPTLKCQGAAGKDPHCLCLLRSQRHLPLQGEAGGGLGLMPSILDKAFKGEL